MEDAIRRRWRRCVHPMRHQLMQHALRSSARHPEVGTAFLGKRTPLVSRPMTETTGPLHIATAMAGAPDGFPDMRQTLDASLRRLDADAPVTTGSVSGRTFLERLSDWIGFITSFVFTPQRQGQRQSVMISWVIIIHLAVLASCVGLMMENRGRAPPPFNGDSGHQSLRAWMEWGRV